MFKDFGRVGRKISRIGTRFGAWLKVRMATQHLSGPRKIKLDDDDVALVCLLKNGSYYVDDLLAHHRALGIKSFLFIDNGSDDDTCAKLAAHSDVTTVSNTLPVARFETRLRSQIARNTVKGGWFLFVDSDELFEFINGAGRTIQDYTRYCSDHGFDAVVAQCLDLVSDCPLSETSDWSFKKSISEFHWYSLNCIENFDYHDQAVGFAWFLRSNTISNPDIKMKYGGIRKELFGENPSLSSHRLVKNARHITIYSHPHSSSNVNCADFSMLLRHYKFAGDYYARERRQLDDKIWDHGEDERRMAVINDRSFVFSAAQLHRFDAADQLVDQGFLHCSETFLSRFPPVSGSGKEQA